MMIPTTSLCLWLCLLAHEGTLDSLSLCHRPRWMLPH